METIILEKRTKRTTQELMGLTREAKRMIEEGVTMTKACEKLNLKYKTFMRYQGSVRTNSHLHKRVVNNVPVKQFTGATLVNVEITALKERIIKLEKMLIDTLVSRL